MARDMAEIFPIFEAMFASDIRSSLAPNERYEDVRRMIRLLADARAERTGSSTIEHYLFSGSVICTIFEPLKLPPFVSAARAFRLRFRGIARDPETVGNFRNSWRDQMLEAADIESALDAGFDALFRVERGMTMA